MLCATKKSGPNLLKVSLKKMEEEKCNFGRDHPVNYLKMAFWFDHRERLENPDGHRRKEIDA